jgi:hypothetical protein
MTLRVNFLQRSALQNDGLDVPIILQYRTARETNPESHWEPNDLFIKSFFCFFPGGPDMSWVLQERLHRLEVCLGAGEQHLPGAHRGGGSRSVEGGDAARPGVRGDGAELPDVRLRERLHLVRLPSQQLPLVRA